MSAWIRCMFVCWSLRFGWRSSGYFSLSEMLRLVLFVVTFAFMVLMLWHERARAV